MADPAAPAPLRPRHVRVASRRIGLERRGAALVFTLFVAGGLLFVFAGALTRANELEAVAAQARRVNEDLEALIQAGYHEVEYIRSDAYMDLAARAIDWGIPGEEPFRLPDDAPSPQPVPVLGAGGGGPPGAAP